jgi:Na+/melibiose symporter-like transporter
MTDGLGVSRKQLAAFILPAAPLMALSLPPIIFLPPYYATYLGIDEAVVGALFLVARAFDLFVNPTIGSLQDRTTTLFGRRRGWLILATPVMMGAIWFAFIAMKPGAPAILAGVAILSLYLSFAAMMIAHLGWAGELSTNYHGRTFVLGAVQAMSVVGQILILALPAIVQTAGLGDFDDGVRLMGWAIIVALPVTIAIATLITPERAAPPAEKAGLREAFAAIAQTPALQRLLVPDFLIGVIQGVAGSLFIFYAQFALGFERQAELLLLAYFVSGLLGVPLWIWLGRRLGKHRALQISCLVWAAALAVVPFAPKGALPVALVILGAAGIAQAAGPMLLRAMMADIADEEELRTGAKRSGLFFGLLLTTTKVGLALGPATYIVLGAFGFEADLGADNAPLAMAALGAMFLGVPIAINLAAALSLQDYPLDEARQKALREAIEARQAEAR